ncbi:MAG TPA: carbohydrate kinase family protein [Chitinispirillaceae bacterium]|nr:carbohydrate kinase family protein [Chitinispirillaceae bacterium]
MKKVLCVGTLIADIINEKIDCLPGEGECVTAEVSLNLGGNAFSSSVNLKRLLNQKSNVYCYGLIGSDMIGSLFEHKLREEGVFCNITKTPNRKTSCNIILQEKDRDRRYIFNEGANTSASKEDVIKIVQKVKPDVVVFGELPSLGLVGKNFLEMIDYIKTQSDSLICLDTLINAEEDYCWLGGNWDKIDIVHCNYGEGLHITKKSTLIEICSWYINNGVRLPIVSDGENGCYFGYKDVIEHVPPFKAKEVDATGAGDAMMAGIITRLLESNDRPIIDVNNVGLDTIREMVIYGSACGCYAIGSIGCISDICKEKIESIFKIGNKAGCAL